MPPTKPQTFRVADLGVQACAAKTDLLQQMSLTKRALVRTHHGPTVSQRPQFIHTWGNDSRYIPWNTKFHRNHQHLRTGQRRLPIANRTQESEYPLIRLSEQ